MNIDMAALHAIEVTGVSRSMNCSKRSSPRC